MTARPAVQRVLHPALADFHPVVQAWFQETLGDPSPPQVQGWPLIRAGRDVLISAPTGSGKTLAAFLACLDALFREAAAGTLPDTTRIVYVSPLKALGNDVQKNLLEPLEQLRARAREAGVTLPEVRVQVRSGDTPASERAKMVKTPPHILITTPESLYLYLTSARSRETLRQVEAVVVDELHALARDKRGSHFALSLERLETLVGKPFQRIGLSATVRPLQTLGAFLTGAPRAGRQPLAFVEVGHLRPWELKVETPDDTLGAVATHEMWGQLYDRLLQLSTEHRTVLVFTNTRRLAERMAHDLGERMGHEKVAAHHGSMARELRLSAEERLKSGALKVMVATASLELGLDIGSIDLVVQVGSPRSIAVMLQRLGRAGHRASAISKGILFAMTRDELVEAVALLAAVQGGRLDAVRLPHKPLDVLAQHLVAEVAAQDWDEQGLLALARRAMPYADLSDAEFEQVVHLLSEGVGTSRGRSRVHLHRDRVAGVLKPRKGARLTAVQNGGAIPDTFNYPVISEPEEKQVGSVDEDFAIDSSAGDVFLLGSTSWRIRRIFGGAVKVENAQGQAPNVPFWRGEAPSRTDELSFEVGALREAVLKRDDVHGWLEGSLGLAPHAAALLVDYVRAGAAALSVAPSTTCVVAERFFDEAGGMQLVIHAPFGARINRAWGMALRKSFCRTFDFELQAAATDDGILLSLSEQHSFPLMDIFDFVSPVTAEHVLVQAVLQAPVFGTRFRWTAGRALVLSRMASGKRVPPPIQRARAEDLIAAVFPEQIGCQDNHAGKELEPPDHPLVNETLKDCTRDFMDIDGLVAVLRALKDGRIQKRAVDLPEPSVFAHQLLNSAPYTFLDEAPLEERRARAVSVRRSLPPADAALAQLDVEAIATVVAQARPEVRDAEELHDALLQLVLVPVESGALQAGVMPPSAGGLITPNGALHAGAWTSPAGDDGARSDTLDGGTPTSPAGDVFDALGSGAFTTPSSDAAARVPRASAPHLAPTGARTAAGVPCPLEVNPAHLATLTAARRVGTVVHAGRAFVFAAERVPQVQALFPDAALPLLPLLGDRPVEREAAVQQTVRGWLEVCGPTTATALALTLGLSRSEVEQALYRIELSGQVLRGTFRPGASAEDIEWCDRRLLQRIHRLTVGRLRREIEPLSAQDFMRFLFRWQHLDAQSRLRGPAGVAKVVALLQGHEAPAAAWEQALLPSRMRQYVGEWLEHACLSGEVAWGRLTLREPKLPPGPRRASPSVDPALREALEEAAQQKSARPVLQGRNANLTFARRSELEWLLHAARPQALLADGPRPLPAELSEAAREVAQCLERRGASFFAELVASTRQLPNAVEDGLWELLARGLVTADAVQNLRVLQSPKLRRAQRATQRGGPGRWSLLRPLERVAPEEVLEKTALLFLQRYGVVFRDLLVREALAPAWRDLLPIYRRLELRGELRGGRFVHGFAGEQFALPEAVDLSRSVRRAPKDGEVVTVSAVDPLNLTGVITPGVRVSAVLGQVVEYVDGIPRAPQASLVPLEPAG